MSERIPTCVWRTTAALLLALDERFGDPDDAYVNGSQVWIRDDGPGGEPIEWRLHPVAGYRRPAGVGTHDVLERVVWALRAGETPPAPPERLWDGLEAFCAFDDDIEPAPLATACATALGVAPDAFGAVDHAAIGDRWEQTSGAISIVEALLGQLDGGA